MKNRDPLSTTYNILIVDDDKKIAELVRRLLNKNNFTAFVANSYDDLKILLKTFNYNLIVLDYMLDNVNGEQIFKELRSNNVLIPVIMLTAVNQINVKLSTLNLGADDYVEKPFHSEELVLRIKNILKRSENSSQYNNIINFCGMQFNRVTGELKRNDNIITLSTQEEQLLQIFTENLGEVLTKETILEAMGKNITLDNLNALNVNIMRLRKKIEEQDGTSKCLKTIRNQGFILIS